MGSVIANQTINKDIRTEEEVCVDRRGRNIGHCLQRLNCHQKTNDPRFVHFVFEMVITEYSHFSYVTIQVLV